MHGWPIDIVTCVVFTAPDDLYRMTCGFGKKNRLSDIVDLKSATKTTAQISGMQGDVVHGNTCHFCGHVSS